MIQGSELREGSDVCVVGAGPAGLTLARMLGVAGRRVCLIESGGFHDSRLAQQLNDGDLEGEPYAGLQSTRHRQVGGTTNTWNVVVRGRSGAKYVPLSPRDLADWPIDWRELEPYYAQAQERCGLGPLEYGAERWATKARQPFSLDGTGLTSGVYQFGHADQFTRRMVEEIRGSRTVTTLPSVTVVGLSAERGRVRGVRAIGEDGRPLEVEAAVVILACGAVENARLLLLQSGGEPSPSPWLGRGFMEHARDFSMTLVPESPDLFARASFYDLHAADSGWLIGGHLRVTDEARERHRLPQAAMTLVPRARTGTGRKITDSLLRVIGVKSRGRYGWSDVRSPEKAFDAFQIVMNLEQRPQPSNRVELSRRSDRLGNPLPRLVLRWTEEEQAELERLRERIAEWMRAARLGRLLTAPGRRPDLNAHHHAGTTRMSRAPEDGVVDPSGLVFGFENLYLAGASVFPTAGFANPTLTIVALALRLARHVDDRLG